MHRRVLAGILHDVVKLSGAIVLHSGNETFFVITFILFVEKYIKTSIVVPRTARTFLVCYLQKSDKGSLFFADKDYLCPKIFLFLCFLADYEGF